MELQNVCSKIIDCFHAFQGKVTSSKYSEVIPMIKGEIIIRHGNPGHGKSVSVQLYSLSEMDTSTGKGKLSQQTYLKHGESEKKNKNSIKYKVEFNVEKTFGFPGAVLIRNEQKHKFFLQSMTLQIPPDQTVHFDCNSWIYPIHLTKQDRILFFNTCFLPNATPEGLIRLREEELRSLRGDGTGERKEWERIYDYDYYNDLGNPDEGPEHARPILGGTYLYPYPRRGRTGRPMSHDDLRIESRPGKSHILDIYVPADEHMSPEKLTNFILNVLQAGSYFLKPHENLSPEEDFTCIESFDQIFELYSGNTTTSTRHVSEEWLMEKLKPSLPDLLFQKIKHAIRENPPRFPLPQIVAGNKLAWKDDEEFARQMLAGVNPTSIQCLQIFPPESKSGVKSSIKKSDIERNLDGLTVQEAMEQWRIFILDHHDNLMPFLSKINTKGICTYASRTLLFLRDDSTLKPLAIELSLPGSSRVFRPAKGGTEGALWHFAKAHVTANDSGYNHLINHWLKTHAIVEPFIISTRRQLSVMHPIHRLLSPHFKDTMHVNALARTMVINSGGILERVLFTGDFSMQFSSFLYKDWRFDEQSLPIDLIKRGMAVANPDQPGGVQLIFQDYPFGIDGLDIWVAIKRWVKDYCSHFYTNDDSLRSDKEIQKWWSEIRNMGHRDKCNETWWYTMTKLSDLIETLTTLIWTVSAFHASLNYGQYGYSGYPPNRPMACREFIPEEGTREFAEFLTDPDKYFLKMLPTRYEMTLGIALLGILSSHTKDEVYLGQQGSNKWIDDVWVNQRFKEFGDELGQVERRILKRNKDPKLKNRRGNVNFPYKLLYPDTSNVESRWGITGKGIPNSISL